jgi:hypothetical protein
MVEESAQHGAGGAKGSGRSAQPAHAPVRSGSRACEHR